MDVLLKSPIANKVVKAIDAWISGDGEAQQWFRAREKYLSRPGYVYLIEAVGSEGIYKVGHSKKPDIRLKALPTKMPYDLRLHSVWETDAMVWAESLVHKEFKQDRCCVFSYDTDGEETGEYRVRHLNGEWFQGVYCAYDQSWCLPKNPTWINDDYSIPYNMEVLWNGDCMASLRKTVSDAIKDAVIWSVYPEADWRSYSQYLQHLNKSLGLSPSYEDWWDWACTIDRLPKLLTA